MVESEKYSSIIFEQLIENIPNSMVYGKIVVDQNNKPIDFIFLETNRAFRKNLGGIPKEKIIGKRVSQVITIDRKMILELIELAGKTALEGGSIEFDYHIEIIQRWYHISAYSPEREYFVAMLEDITDRMTLLEKTREAEQKYRNIVENVKDAVIIIGFDGKLHYQSPQFPKLVGRESLGDDLITVGQFIHKDDLQGLLNRFRISTEEREVVNPP